MFYKDRTLLKMSLRKTLGFSPHVGCKGSISLSISTQSFSLSLLVFLLGMG